MDANSDGNEVKSSYFLVSSKVSSNRREDILVMTISAVSLSSTFIG